ncbi:MAG TPA: membrane protein insertion efficiency factor YidD [Oceanipulchritudo sp.]|nr:membrane protein insertion efficiency factor YidD [Oceanipulchritudo sp.]
MRILTQVQHLLRYALTAVLIAVLMVYRYGISPLLHMIAPGSGCRFQPSCSNYALQAIREHGPFSGTWLAAKRVAQCHPWGGHGYDPVPDSCSCAKHQDPQHPSLLEPVHTKKSHHQAHP